MKRIFVIIGTIALAIYTMEPAAKYDGVAEPGAGTLPVLHLPAEPRFPIDKTGTLIGSGIVCVRNGTCVTSYGVVIGTSSTTAVTFPGMVSMVTVR